MFRIYRDVRFSRDKSPYKTHAAAQFRHTAGKNVHAPGFYVHLSPEEVLAGTGIWRPDATALAAVRKAIAEDPDVWDNAITDSTFTRRHRLSGESLKRPPRGFDPDHPKIDDIKRKDFVSMVDLKPKDTYRPGFLEDFAEICTEAKPFVGFLTEAVGLPF
jgi:uncharacterized protein (TIGR02453 family)